jgi:hypothetical protein
VRCVNRYNYSTFQMLAWWLQLQSGLSYRCNFYVGVSCTQVWWELSTSHITNSWFCVCVCVCVCWRVHKKSLKNFVANNPNKFKTNLSVHSLKTRPKNHPYIPKICFSSTQKGMTYSAIKVFSNLPPHITKLLNNKQQLKHALQECLIIHAFYSLELFLS